MKNIVIVTTGGTIAMKKLPAGVDITPEGNQEIMDQRGLRISRRSRWSNSPTYRARI